jgi:hypothetical protein
MYSRCIASTAKVPRPGASSTRSENRIGAKYGMRSSAFARHNASSASWATVVGRGLAVGDVVHGPHVFGGLTSVVAGFPKTRGVGVGAHT